MTAMVTVAAFKDGFAAFRTNPILLLAGLFIGIGSQLQLMDHLVESPFLSAGISLAWIVIFPFVLGGFIDTARGATEGTGTSVSRFFSAAWAHYFPLLLGTILFVVIVFGTAISFGFISFALGFGSMGLGVVNEMAGFVVGVGYILVWLLFILVVTMFVQFYHTAIVIENKDVTGAFRRSTGLVSSNLKSVTVFSLTWFILLNTFLIPEYLIQMMLTDARGAGVLPIDLGLPKGVLILSGIGLSAIGFTYFYTVYTAYYLRLIDASPGTSGPV